MEEDEDNDEDKVREGKGGVPLQPCVREKELRKKWKSVCLLPNLTMKKKSFNLLANPAHPSSRVRFDPNFYDPEFSQPNPARTHGDPG